MKCIFQNKSEIQIENKSQLDQFLSTLNSLVVYFQALSNESLTYFALHHNLTPQNRQTIIKNELIFLLFRHLYK